MTLAPANPIDKYAHFLDACERTGNSPERVAEYWFLSLGEVKACLRFPQHVEPHVLQYVRRRFDRLTGNKQLKCYQSNQTEAIHS